MTRAGMRRLRVAVELVGTRPVDKLQQESIEMVHTNTVGISYGF